MNKSMLYNYNRHLKKGGKMFAPIARMKVRRVMF
jgi:hypothetical protein